VILADAALGSLAGVDRDSLASLRRSPGYTRFWCAATLARLANEMAAVGVVLYVLDRTGSAAWAGATLAALTLPSIASGPLLGAWLDRGGRRVEAIRADQAVSVAMLAAIALAAGDAPDFLLPLAALPAGITFPLSTGGFSSLIPSYVAPALRVQANALEASSYNVGIVAGPALAGVLVTAVDPLAAVLAQLGLKLAALGLALTLPRAHDLPSRPDLSVMRVTADGFRRLVASRPLLAATVSGSVALAGRGLLALAFPFFAVEELGEPRGFSGWLWAAFAVGSLLGAVGPLGIQARRRPHEIVIWAAGASGMVMLLWPLASAPLLALALIALGGFVYGPGLVATFSVRQEEAPAELQTQVFMTGSGMKTAAFALGAAASGPLVTEAGAAETMLLAAAIHLVAAGAGAAIARDPR
jgi:MFS family permease